jgi:proteic killer suppression protein
VGIVSFANTGTEDGFEGEDSRKARHACPAALWDVARRKLDQLNAAVRLADLRLPHSNHSEPLEGDRKAQHGIRITQRYRLCFEWTEHGPAGVAIV